MAHYVVCNKKIISGIFKISGALIVIIACELCVDLSVSTVVAVITLTRLLSEPVGGENPPLYLEPDHCDQ